MPIILLLQIPTYSALQPTFPLGRTCPFLRGLTLVRCCPALLCPNGCLLMAEQDHLPPLSHRTMAGVVLPVRTQQEAGATQHRCWGKALVFDSTWDYNPCGQDGKTLTSSFQQSLKRVSLSHISACHRNILPSMQYTWQTHSPRGCLIILKVDDTPVTAFSVHCKTPLALIPSLCRFPLSLPAGQPV